MQKHESGEENSSVQDEIVIDQEQNQSKKIEEKQSFVNIELEKQSPTEREASSSQKQPKQAKLYRQLSEYNQDVSLENISIQSPIKKNLNKSQSKIIEKQIISLSKISQKFQTISRQKLNSDAISNTKLNSESYMKSSIKSSNRVKKINKPFYEETFYITGMKENYLLLLSDTNQVLEFPIGMFTIQGENGDPQNFQEEGSNPNENFHLIKDIKIGQPIKIKLQIDFLRQEKDDRIFNSLQRNIHEEYSEVNEESLEKKNQQISLKKNNK